MNNVMLICDGCDRHFHQKCHEPPVTVVPDGDWFCSSCETQRACDAAEAAMLEEGVERRSVRRASHRASQMGFQGNIPRGDLAPGDRRNGGSALECTTFDKPGTSNPQSEQVIFRKNQKVEGKFRNGLLWYPGTISKKRKVGEVYKYDIRYDDGDTEGDVPARRIRQKR